MVSLVSFQVSIVVPVHNGGESFRQCLASLLTHASSAEIIVVADGDSDGSWRHAEAAGVKVLRVEVAGGPAKARNLGAKAAQGDILFFVDADVTIAPTTLDQIVTLFRNNSDLTAVIGSYDDAPGAKNFLSQYKNLFHHYTHQTAREEASTFWGACGAIRRDVFLSIGGFDERYRYPSIEDIELGYRLRRAGYNILLCKTLQVKHLKHWKPISLLRAEIFYRALPWTELILRDRLFVNDLNLSSSNRLSVILTFGLLGCLVGLGWSSNLFVLASLFSLALLIINSPVYRFFWEKRGFAFTLRVIPWHWLYFLYSGLSFAWGTVNHHTKQYLVRPD